MKAIRNLYIQPRFYFLGLTMIAIAIISFIWYAVYSVAIVGAAVIGIMALVDIYLLYGTSGMLIGRRVCPEMFSNGDDNEVLIILENLYPFAVQLHIKEEAPVQFQKRQLVFELELASGVSKTIKYELKPTFRGNYDFGSINAFTTSFLGLVSRRIQIDGGQQVKVYPSIQQMRKADLMLFSKNDLIQGIKKVRRVGQHTEFEEIKEYNTGDDFRRINWKATARKNHLMLNVFQEEKSRPIYSVINKGRTMQMPFGGLSLFDYAVNTSLAMTNIILKRSDKAGLITFEKKVDTLLKASSSKTQLKTILELLYAEKTNFAEPNYYDLYLTLRRQLSQRSVLLLYTNFESHTSLEHQLDLFKKLNKAHVLVVIFFENTELQKLLGSEAKTMEEVYQLAIAEKFDMEKRVIMKELARNGIQCMLTKPESLTVDTINKYLEIKSKGLI